MFILSDLEGAFVLLVVGMASVWATAYCYTKLVAFHAETEQQEKRLRVVTYAVVFLVALVSLGVGVASDPTLRGLATSKVASGRPILPFERPSPLAEAASQPRTFPRPAVSVAHPPPPPPPPPASTATTASAEAPSGGRLSKEDVMRTKFWFNVVSFLLAAFLLLKSKSSSSEAPALPVSQ